MPDPTPPPSGSYNLFVVTEPNDPVKCCFCPQPIARDSVIYQVVENRYCHYSCLERLALLTLEKRDSLGKSEDRL